MPANRASMPCFFPYDTTRARPDDLENLCKGIMAESPPDSIGIVDTMGCATPEAIKIYGPVGEKA